MTKGQKAAIAKGVKAAISHERSTTGEILGAVEDLCITIIELALKAVPDDRSCHTCDFLHGSMCRNYDSEIPTEFLEKGCEEWQDHGAPF